ncbi:EXS-domain-containing protein [Phlegmacium glaucopus]|nr:EXS-domain-containing protein [Phlegmacium glaucopus]
MWCHQQYNRGTVFGVWVVVNTCYSIYACTWDILADYSFLQPHSKHLFLRTELMYTPQFVYYLAMLSNLVIRFLWIIYIPQRGPNMMVRTFITGIFEMLRRIQWNFYRLENEHVGNMDQYRVTRETPLPYAFDFPVREQDRDDNHTLASKR